MDQDGQLSFKEFCIAMELINNHKKGIELPTSVPEILLASLRDLDRSNLDFQNVSSQGNKSDSGSNSPILGSNNLFNTGLSGSNGSLPQVQLKDQELTKLKSEIIEKLRKKESLIKSIRQIQQQNLELASANSKTQSKMNKLKEVNHEIELLVEKKKIQTKSSQSKIALKKQKLNDLNEQKLQYESLIVQKREQYAMEIKICEDYNQKVNGNKVALEKQEIERLNNESEQAKKVVKKLKKSRICR